MKPSLAARVVKAMEGFLMSYGLPNSPDRSSSSFRKVVGVFLSSEGLPFAKILTADRIERIFAKHGCLFGVHGIYTTAIMIWSFLSQVLRDGKEASCQAAVARVVSYCEQSGIDSPTSDTFDPQVAVRGRHRGNGPLLLFVHDDRVAACARNAGLRAEAPSASHGLSPREAAGQVRLPHRVDASAAAGMDG